MVTLEIRDLPDAAYAVVRQRARDPGQSLEAYLRQTLINLALTPTKAAVILDIERSLAADGGLVVPDDAHSSGGRSPMRDVAT